MNLQKLFDAQKKLDDRIRKEKGLEGQDLLDKKILALQVELGELANELPEVFKFWSNKKNNYKKALEEYCDCLHFILSIGNDIGYRPTQPKAIKKSSIIEQFHEMFYLIADLHYCSCIDVSEFEIAGKYLEVFEFFLGLGEILGFTWEQIEQTYFDKNQINHERQENGY